MASTEDRINELVRQFLEVERELDLDANFNDAGVSSVDALAFIKTVNREFDISIPPRI
ncbi:MAG: acyl carrier protein [Proteobacteria bacterium]|nr:acyl carrier protein [Pseudomonadota bacterium]